MLWSAFHTHTRIPRTSYSTLVTDILLEQRRDTDTIPNAPTENLCAFHPDPWILGILII